MGDNVPCGMSRLGSLLEPLLPLTLNLNPNPNPNLKNVAAGVAPRVPVELPTAGTYNSDPMRQVPPQHR